MFTIRFQCDVAAKGFYYLAVVFGFMFLEADFYFKLLVAFIPAVVLGLLFSKKIDALLENPVTVAVTLLLGGILLLKVDDWFGKWL